MLEDRTLPLRPALAVPPVSAPRYRPRDVIAEGGMGEVLLVHDTQIGRDVAMKIIKRDPDVYGADSMPRFVQEARLQGRLEHPSIVPLYDAGVSPDGEHYFTMRHVRGETLREIFDGLIDHPAETEARHSRRKLLTAFSNICLVVDFAHRRGVVHRDLKPGNIMLGDFGEVYLLDWGLAKILDDDTPPLTSAGSSLGTPGYMAPEQTRGAADSRADIYALGAILFELLALQRLHPQASVKDKLASTRAGADARASVRAPKRHVPPELEEICVRATALDPADRYASARELHQAIERYLDGDRDLELREKLAESHAAAAETIVTRVLEEREPDREEDDRGAAMSELGRALALDPRNRRATAAMARLLAKPPKTTLRAARATLEMQADHATRTALKRGIFTYGTWLLFAPLFAISGEFDFVIFAFVWGGILATMAVNALGLYRRSFATAAVALSLILTSAVIAGLSRMFGPLVLVPALAVANTMAYAISPHRWMRPIVYACGVLVIGGPLMMEWTGLVAPSYIFHDGLTCLAPRPESLTPATATTFLTLASIGGVVVSSWFMMRVGDAVRASEEKLHHYAWHCARLIGRG